MGVCKGGGGAQKQLLCKALSNFHGHLGEWMRLMTAVCSDHPAVQPLLRLDVGYASSRRHPVHAVCTGGWGL